MQIVPTESRCKITVDNIQEINGLMYGRMICSGARNLRSHAQAINNLNVFPIPDGDTGDNMMLTMLGGGNAIGTDNEDISIVSRRVADGMLLSARGNSGVILSQFFDGIADGLSGLKTADNTQFSKALRCGVEHAYNAVIEPTEGTILTVARTAAEYTCSRISNTTEEMLENFISEAKRTLDKTPEMLPVLKKAGVVDSGGAGLIYIMEGMLSAINNKFEDSNIQPFTPSEPDIDLNLFTEDSILEYGYCTELLIRLQRAKTDTDSFDVKSISDYLLTIGDSVVAFKTGSAVKVHVHTMTPDKVLAHCQKYGEFLKVKVENMSLQHNNAALDAINISTKQDDTLKKYGVVAVAAGNGIKEMFTERGTDVIVEGGQTMNPSAEDFIAAFKKINAENILVFPNNSNIILTAKQAASMYKDANIYVIESRNIGEGYAALSMLDTDSGDTNQIINELTDAMKGVATAEISKCIRDAVLENAEIHDGDYIGIESKNILAVSSDRLQTAYSTIDKLNPANYDICILIYGKNVSGDEADSVSKYINTNYNGKEVYIVNGMQDIYDYILIFE